MVAFVMSNFLNIKSIFRDYSVDFCNSIESLGTELRTNDFVILDSKVNNLYPEISTLVKDNNKYIVSACEESKSYDAISDVFKSIIESGFSKTDRIIAIGGGVTQDISGFVSSLLYRGVSWFFYPTNLLTQCDSCIGSKTSINFGEFKNQLGGFYPPEKIIIDTNFLDTISDIEISSGLGEMLHYFLIDGYESNNILLSELKDARGSRDVLITLIKRSLNIKKKMIEVDEFDKGPRNIFNYGHSFGHALESVTNYEIPHGVAVAYGMDLANLISVHKGLLNMSQRNEFRVLLNEVFSDITLPNIDVNKFLLALSKDKKNEGSKIKVILTRGPRDMFKTTLDKDDDLVDLLSDFFELKLYKDAL